MTSFKGINCPICNVPFSDADDIVVCPQCGAPYHRACYKQIGHCLYNHEAGEAWQTPETAKPDTEDSIRCPQCGTDNPAGSLFCSTCGKSLTAPPEEQQTPPSGNPASGYANFFTAVSGLHPEELIADDVTVDEASKAVQINSLYYIPVFKSIRERGRSRFNFSALFFPGGWLLYRKQYKLGGLVIGVQALMNLISTLVMMFVAQPLMVEIYTKCGIDPATVALTHEQQMIIAAESQNYPQLFWISVLSYLPLLINVVIAIVMGFKANRIYYHHIVKKVRRIRESLAGGSQEDYQSQLFRQGGVNPKVILIIALLNMALYYVPLILF